MNRGLLSKLLSVGIVFPVVPNAMGTPASEPRWAASDRVDRHYKGISSIENRHCTASSRTASSRDDGKWQLHSCASRSTGISSTNFEFWLVPRSNYRNLVVVKSAMDLKLLQSLGKHEENALETLESISGLVVNNKRCPSLDNSLDHCKAPWPEHLFPWLDELMDGRNTVLAQDSETLWFGNVSSPDWTLVQVKSIDEIRIIEVTLADGPSSQANEGLPEVLNRVTRSERDTWAGESVCTPSPIATCLSPKSVRQAMPRVWVGSAGWAFVKNGNFNVRLGDGPMQTASKLKLYEAIQKTKIVHSLDAVSGKEEEVLRYLVSGEPERARWQNPRIWLEMVK